VELQVNCTGWTAISILAPDGSVDDIILSGYNDSDRVGYVEDRNSKLLNPVHQGAIDGRQDVLLVEADYRQPWTVVRWQRSINTGDLEDVVLWVNSIGFFDLNKWLAAYGHSLGLWLFMGQQLIYVGHFDYRNKAIKSFANELFI
jgi:hypothetical protein